VNSSDTPLPTPPPPTSPQQLHYARRPPLLQRLRTGRSLTLLAIVVILALSPKWEPPVWQRLQEIYWQQECLSHPIPPGVVVYSSGPPVVSVVSRPWSRLDAVVSPYGARSSGTVYLGERTAINGLRKLIGVDVTVDPFANRLGAQVAVTINARVIQEGGVMSAPMETENAWEGYERDSSMILPQPSGDPASKPTLVVYSATEDLANPAHFRFYYDTASGRVVYDCWLLVSGSVRLDRTRLSGPTTTSSSQPAR